MPPRQPSRHRFDRRAVAVLLAVAVLPATPQLAAPAAARPDAGVAPQIVGGTPVPDDRYSFMAAIMQAPLPNPAEGVLSRLYCSGELVAPQWVMSAGHCGELFRAADGTMHPELTEVILGRNKLTGDSGRGRKVTEILVHPQYLDIGIGIILYDVALFKLAEPVDDVRPVELATADDDALEATGKALTAVGWGRTGTDEPVSDDLLMTTLTAVSDEACGQRFAATDLQLCAGGDVGAGVCFGDSGGPLLGADPDGRPVVIAITSSGPECGSGLPGYFTEVNSTATSLPGDVSIWHWITSTAGLPG